MNKMNQYLIYYESGEYDAYEFVPILIASDLTKTKKKIKELQKIEDELYNRFKKIRRQLEDFEDKNDPCEITRNLGSITDDEMDQYLDKFAEFRSKLLCDNGFGKHDSCRLYGDKKVYSYLDLETI